MPPTPEDQLGPGGGCTSQDIELMDIAAVCAFFGGSRPLNPATIYRGVAEGRYPQPIKVGKNSNRWLRGECVATLATLIARLGHRGPIAARPRNGISEKRHHDRDGAVSRVGQRPSFARGRRVPKIGCRRQREWGVVAHCPI